MPSEDDSCGPKHVKVLEYVNYLIRVTQVDNLINIIIQLPFIYENWRPTEVRLVKFGAELP
jgi:hypothetical protein